MPYPNEHACRLHNPSGYTDFRRTTRRSGGKTYSVITGKKRSGSWEEQAYRYPKSGWSVSQARAHCRRHDGIRFEPASESSQNQGRSHVMKHQSNMATLQIGLPVREETFEGNAHLVVPVVALVEGVHVGSAGAYYYPADAIGEIPDCWNGIPLPVFHPEEYGKNVSANTPHLIEERSVGRLFHTFYDTDGHKLKGELWINIEKAEKISPEVLAIIRSGRQLEVSTALWFDDDGVPGNWNGERYEGTVSNFRPDHLALLPGGEGACSWSDGCGVRVNKNTPKGGKPMETKEEPGIKVIKDRVVGALRAIASSVGVIVQDMSHEDLRSKLQHALDALDTRDGSWVHNVRAVFDDSVIYEARGNNPSESGGVGGIVKLYQVGYSLNDDTGEVKLKENPKEVREETSYIEVEQGSATGNKSENQKTKEDQEMEKKELIGVLIGCDQTKFTEEDKPWLDTLEVGQLEKLRAPAKNEEPPKEEPPKEEPPKKEPPKEEPKGNEDPKPKTAEEYVAAAPPEIQSTLNRALKRDQATKNALVKALMANDRNKFTEEQLKAKEIGELENLTELANVEVDFSAQTGGPTAREDETEAPEMPATFDLTGAKKE